MHRDTSANAKLPHHTSGNDEPEPDRGNTQATSEHGFKDFGASATKVRNMCFINMVLYERAAALLASFSHPEVCK